MSDDGSSWSEFPCTALDSDEEFGSCAREAGVRVAQPFQAAVTRLNPLLRF